MAENENLEAISAFITGAPPGELTDVVKDIQNLTTDDPSLLRRAGPAFQKYNEEQLACVKLPGGSQNVLVSEHNRMENGRYFDISSRSSWRMDHAAQRASDVQSYAPETQQIDLITTLHRSFSLHATEHYPSSTVAVVPSSNDEKLTLLLVANKYSPSNFWSGRFRATYAYDTSSSSLTGTIRVDVHYYEDGNVRLTTSKLVPETRVSSGRAGDVVREIGKIERKYHEDLNRGFTELNEGGFKGLRRPLPVSRQKMEWEKVSSYRAGREIGGARR